MADLKGGRVPLHTEAGEKPFAQYVAAVGEVAFHWNALLEALGSIFCLVTATPRSVGFGIWYALKSDLAQMDILRAALRGRDGLHPAWTDRGNAHADIEWVINEIRGRLSERRNDAIHAPAALTAPIWMDTKGEISVGEVEIGPSFFHGHPRATRLKGKALIEEITWYAATAKVLANFASEMDGALRLADEPWPERPRLPNLGSAGGT